MSAGEQESQEPEAQRRTVVVAMGGHAFMQEGEEGTHGQHKENARRICKQLMVLADGGYNIVVTHGNGPQVGNLMRREELSRGVLEPRPLDVLVAQTEGSLGYYLQQELLNELRGRDIRRFVVTVVTQVLVDPEDPAFAKPSKPVGPFLSKEEAEARQQDEGWQIAEDGGGRGWRRVVPSPLPRRVVQRDMIGQAAAAGNIVVAAGGGGIPICIAEDGDYVGVEAVIDKDLTSSVLAADVGAELLIILTAVDGVYLNFGKPDQRMLGAVTLAECEQHLAKGRFPPGSMGPKVEAIYQFLQAGGRRGLITSADKLADALKGKAGTHFIGML